MMSFARETLFTLTACLLFVQIHAYLPVSLPSGVSLRGSAPSRTAVSMNSEPLARRQLLQVLVAAPALVLSSQAVVADVISADSLLKQWTQIGEKVKKQQDELTEDEWKNIQGMLQRLTLSKSDVEQLAKGLSSDKSEKITKIATTMKFQAMAADEPAQLRDAVGFLNEYPSLEDSLREIAALRKQ